MTIKTSGSKLHWNYFLALERDMEAVSRFIEFDPANFDVFSIELARLLFAAASEVDVMAKLICRQVDPYSEASSINGYKTALVPAVPTILTTAVNVPRYGLSLQPWENWQTPGDQSHPDWWNAYNKVKHHRSTRFHRATPGEHPERACRTFRHQLRVLPPRAIPSRSAAVCQGRHCSARADNRLVSVRRRLVSVVRAS